MKKPSKKLSLAKQTVVHLSSVELVFVGGALAIPAGASSITSGCHICIATRNDC